MMEDLDTIYALVMIGVYTKIKCQDNSLFFIRIHFYFRLYFYFC